jgi:hypothetical protein
VALPELLCDATRGAHADPEGFALVGSIYDGTHRALHGDELGPPPPRLTPVSDDACTVDADDSAGDADSSADGGAEGGGERSREGGESDAEDAPITECTLEIAAGAEALEISWVDCDGVTHAYGRVAAHSRRSQRTFAGHVWQVAVARDDAASASAGADGSERRRRYRAGGRAAHELIEAGDDLDDGTALSPEQSAKPC